MDHVDEAAALGAIQERLSDRFPRLAPEVVEAAVRMAYADLDGPIREFVPVLVENIARSKLAQIARAT